MIYPKKIKYESESSPIDERLKRKQEYLNKILKRRLRISESSKKIYHPNMFPKDFGTVDGSLNNPNYCKKKNHLSDKRISDRILSNTQNTNCYPSSNIQKLLNEKMNNYDNRSNDYWHKLLMYNKYCSDMRQHKEDEERQRKIIETQTNLDEMMKIQMEKQNQAIRDEQEYSKKLKSQIANWKKEEQQKKRKLKEKLLDEKSMRDKQWKG